MSEKADRVHSMRLFGKGGAFFQGSNTPSGLMLFRCRLWENTATVSCDVHFDASIARH